MIYRTPFIVGVFFLTASLLPILAAAQIPTDGNNTAPVEISADKSLVWNRAAKTFTAKDRVVAKKDTAEIHCDTLTAAYDDKSGGMKIQSMTADGHVTISSPPYTAYGDHAVYDVTTGNATLTGQNLRIETETEKLTSSEKIEYIGADDKAVARGRAVATKGTNQLTADTLTAFFDKDSTGKRITKKITAEGNVVIATEKETINGKSGVYDVASQKATLEGPVRILQGDSWLEGTRATVDMKTGISQLFGDGNAATEGRVRGVFYPGKTPTKP